MYLCRLMPNVEILRLLLLFSIFLPEIDFFSSVHKLRGTGVWRAGMKGVASRGLWKTVGRFGFPITEPTCQNSVLWLPDVCIISPYGTAAHGPVTSVAFILTPMFILGRPATRQCRALLQLCYLLSTCMGFHSTVGLHTAASCNRYVSLNIVISRSSNCSKFQTELQFSVSKNERL